MPSAPDQDRNAQLSAQKIEARRRARRTERPRFSLRTRLACPARAARHAHPHAPRNPRGHATHIHSTCVQPRCTTTRGFMHRVGTPTRSLAAGRYATLDDTRQREGSETLQERPESRHIKAVFDFVDKTGRNVRSGGRKKAVPRVATPPFFAKTASKRRLPGTQKGLGSLHVVHFDEFCPRSKNSFHRGPLSGAWPTVGAWRKAPGLTLGRARKALAYESSHETTGAPAYCARPFLAHHRGASVLAARPPSATPEPATRPPPPRARRDRPCPGPARSPWQTLALRARGRAGSTLLWGRAAGFTPARPPLRRAHFLTSCAAAFSSTSACAASSFSS